MEAEGLRGIAQDVNSYRLYVDDGAADGPVYNSVSCSC